MATAKEQLLSMMNPQQARLMDQQLRQQQVAQRAQGAGMLSGLVQAYTGMGDMAQRVGGIMPMGAMEAENIRKRKVLEDEVAKQEKKKGTRKGLEIKEASELVKMKVADGKITQEEGLSLVRMVAQDLMSFEDVLNKFGVGDSGEWRALGDGKTIYNTKTGAEKDIGDNSGFDLLTPKEVLQHAKQYTSESLEAWQNSISKDNPSGDISLLKNLVEETQASVSAIKAYDARQQQMGVHNSMVGKLGQLASRLEANADNMSSGIKADIESFSKEIFGTQDYESLLRAQVEDARAQVAVSNLPPGVASDADVALVLRGTLPSSADARMQARFLRGIAKIEKAKADSISDMQLYADRSKDKSLIGYETYRQKKLASETLDFLSTKSEQKTAIGMTYKEVMDDMIEVIDSGNAYEIDKEKRFSEDLFGVDFVTAYMNLQRL